jgi:hypothetical protein
MLFRTVIAVFKCRKMFYLNDIFCKIMRVAHKVLQHFLYFIENQQISESEQHNWCCSIFISDGFLGSMKPNYHKTAERGEFIPPPHFEAGGESFFK